MTIIVWLRNNLRVHDNPSLFEAIKTGQKILLCDICDVNNPYSLLKNAKLWRENACNNFEKTHNINILRLSGDPLVLLPKLMKEYNANEIYTDRVYEPSFLELEKKIKTKVFRMNILIEPWELKQYKIYSAFAKQAIHMINSKMSADCVIDPNQFIRVDASKKPQTIEGWDVSEKGGLTQLNTFVEKFLDQYEETRNFPAVASSKLSPYLNSGLLSINKVWQYVRGNFSFSSELLWNQFAYHTLFYAPKLPYMSLKDNFNKISWRDNEADFLAWCNGKTGFPIVDAGMRELVSSGFMHNRVRMITASFLVKDLGISWQKGAQFFLTHLYDASIAINSFNWQWAAGCGFDAMPFFRVFNPSLQFDKFDKNAIYVKKWVPEWNDSQRYVKPIVDHNKARHKILQIYKEISHEK